MEEDPVQKARRLRQASAVIKEALHDAAERLQLVRSAVARQRVSEDIAHSLTDALERQSPPSKR
ncbi:hypothetical protein AVHM3334_18570 [Acidovorax sp. SUPP3334]|nr:hypothetical protein AVHM3334_18570 [Acidovorax sp. SUPP3334]